MASPTDDLRRLYADADATALAEFVHRGEVKPAELVEAAIAAIDEVNPQLNAVIHKAYDQARTVS